MNRFAALAALVIFCTAPSLDISVLTVVANSTSHAAVQTPSGSSGEIYWVKVGERRLKTRIYQSTRMTDSPVLIMVLHGDAPFRPPSYQYAFARQAAAQLENVVVTALLRPGYSDDTGDRSDGERGLTTGDNYTPEVVDEIAAVIAQLKTKYHASHVIVTGHSGGAAITGDLLGRRPEGVDAALMVSCPCNVTAWRKHMQAAQGGDIWTKPIHSLSPIDLVLNIPQSIRVRMVVGADDPVTPVRFTQEYAEALRAHKIEIAVTVAPGLKHDILLEPVVFQQLKTLVEAIVSGGKV